MKLGSLFTGIGGFDLGFERAGFEVAWQVEFDKHAQSVLKAHWPNVQLEGDVRDVGKHNLSSVDVLVGGFPCQDLSVAGRRAGLAGERSGLFYEFARIIDELQPTWVVIENVPGLLSSRGGRDMGAVLGTLSELGYGWAYRVLDAQYLGVPQRRKRVFIVGHIGAGSRRAAEVLFEPESLRGDSPPSRAAWEGVTYGTAPCLTGSGRGTERAGDSRGQDPLVIAIQDGREIEKRQNGLGVSGEGVAYTIDGTGAQAVGYVPEVAYTIAAREAKGVSLLESQTNYVARGVVRRLTPKECLRLQGFPDTWHDVQWSHADADEADAREILRCLWRSTYTWAREGWGSRIPTPLLTPEVLLAGVYGGWLPWSVAEQCATRRGQIPGQDAWPEGFMQRLLEAAEYRPAPYRRESFEQLARELGGSLSELPLEETRAAETMFRSGLRADSPAEWPVRYARSAPKTLGGSVRSARQSVPLADSHRYRQIGNAVAVPVAAWIANRIAQTYA